MRQNESFNFALLEDVQAKVLEIPYKGKDLSMIVLLPNEINGLQKVKTCIYNSSTAWLFSKDTKFKQGENLWPNFLKIMKNSKGGMITHLYITNI